MSTTTIPQVVRSQGAKDYNITIYIAEFVNTLTNLTYGTPLSLC